MIQKFEDFIKSNRIKEENFTPQVKEDVEDKLGKKVSGLKEVIEIEGLGKMKAKLDSGNTAMNALIVQDYYEDKDNKTVKFEYDGQEMNYDVVKHIRIWHHGKATERPVIKVNITFNGKSYPDEYINLKISDLAGSKDYRSRMLLCKDFMSRAKIIIDPSKEFELTDKKEIKKNKKSKK